MKTNQDQLKVGQRLKHPQWGEIQLKEAVEVIDAENGKQFTLWKYNLILKSGKVGKREYASYILSTRRE